MENNENSPMDAQLERRAIPGVYADNPTNRRLGRAGQPFTRYVFAKKGQPLRRAPKKPRLPKGGQPVVQETVEQPEIEEPQVNAVKRGRGRPPASGSRKRKEPELTDDEIVKLWNQLSSRMNVNASKAKALGRPKARQAPPPVTQEYDDGEETEEAPDEGEEFNENQN